jgi:hypothetical protein
MMHNLVSFDPSKNLGSPRPNSFYCTQQVNTPTVPSSVIMCQFYYLTDNFILFHIMSFHVISCHVMSFNVILYVIGYFLTAFHKVWWLKQRWGQGRARGEKYVFAVRSKGNKYFYLVIVIKTNIQLHNCHFPTLRAT